MPKILFASNNIADFPGMPAYTENGSYDPARVPYSIRAISGVRARTAQFDPTTTEYTWVHYSIYTSNPYSNDLVNLYDKNGVFLLSVAHDDGFVTIKTKRGTAVTDEDFQGPVSTNFKFTMDVAVRITALATEYVVYLGGNYIGEGSNAGNLPGGVNQPQHLELEGGLFNPAISEIILADGDTRNSRLNVLAPIAIGEYSEWNGDLSTLQDSDDTTGLTTTEAEKRQSFTLAGYTGSANISNVVAISSTIRGINAPESLSHSVRLNSLDYYGDAQDVEKFKTMQVTDWELNPATSLPWTKADLTNVEVGFKSIA